MNKYRCRNCKNFVQRKRGARGGLTGICKLSKKDMEAFIEQDKRRKPNKSYCSNWEDDGGLDFPDDWKVTNQLRSIRCDFY